MKEKVARNAPCPCGSGRKYKSCCFGKAAAGAPRSPAGRSLPTGALLLVLGLAAALAVGVRLRLLGVPLERDEGEYAYFAQLLLQGVPPYGEAYTMKPPGVSGVYALFLLAFGHTTVAVHLGLLLANLGSAALLFHLFRKVADVRVAAVGTATFLLSSLTPTVMGVAGHATHFVVLFVLAGLSFLVPGAKTARSGEGGSRGSLAAAGACFGLAVLMKTHAVAFFLFALLAVLRGGREADGRRIARRVGVFCLGALAPILMVTVLLALAGALSQAWFWTVEYAATYGAGGGTERALQNLGRMLPVVTRGFLPVWGLAAAGILLALVQPSLRHLRAPLATFVLLSLAAVVPGFYFRHHYFVLLLPALAFAVALAVERGRGWLEERGWSRLALAPFAVWLGALGWAVYSHSGALFVWSPAEYSRALYGRSPFVESGPVGEFIRENTDEDDTVAVLGSEPQIAFHARRRSASGFVYVYPLMESHGFAADMQREMIAEIEEAEPEMLIFVNVPTSWLRQPESHGEIYRWYEAYRREHYEQVGVADMLSDAETVYRWGDEARGYVPRADRYVKIFRRKSEGT